MLRELYITKACLTFLRLWKLSWLPKKLENLLSWNIMETCSYSQYLLIVRRATATVWSLSSSTGWFVGKIYQWILWRDCLYLQFRKVTVTIQSSLLLAYKNGLLRAVTDNDWCTPAFWLDRQWLRLSFYLQDLILWYHFQVWLQSTPMRLLQEHQTNVSWLYGFDIAYPFLTDLSGYMHGFNYWFDLQVGYV